MKPTCLENPRPSAQVWEPLECSLQALDRDSSLPLPLPLLRGHVRLSRLGHLPAATHAFPFLCTSWKISSDATNQPRLKKRSLQAKINKALSIRDNLAGYTFQLINSDKWFNYSPLCSLEELDNDNVPWLSIYL